MHLSLKKRIILFFLLAMMLIVAFFASYFYHSTRKMLSDSEHNLELIVSNSITHDIQDNLDYTEANVRAVVENEKVQELFANRDRNGLYEYLRPSYESMKEEFPQAHFHLPDSTSFLRMNKPEKFGDSLKSFRFTVNEANSSKKTVKGIEAGVSGFGFRVVMPVLYKGVHLGSFEFGREMEHSFLETLKQSYNGDFSLYKLDEEGCKFVSSTASDEPVDFLFPDKLKEIQNGNSIFLTSDDKSYNYYILPLKSFDGKTLGFLQFTEDRSAVVEQEKKLIHSLFVVVLVMLAVVPIFATLFLTIAFRPLHTLVRDAEVIAQGDFTKNFVTNRKDEIGLISKSLNHISVGLREMFHVIGDTSSNVINASEEISASGQEMIASNEEVYRNVHEVSEIAAEQLASVDSAKESVQFMVERIFELNESVKTINASMDSVINLQETSERNNSKIEKLSAGSVKIEEIVRTIRRIAEETNILALNASIEAARAGEAGRGLAVVASEVSRLADQSKIATNSIAVLIREVRENIESVVSSSVENNEKLDEGVLVVQESKATFASISTEVQTIVKQVTDITEKVSRIHEKIDILLSGFQEIVKKSDNTMIHIDSVKEISEAQKTAMDEIGHSTMALESMSAELKEAVSKFKY